MIDQYHDPFDPTGNYARLQPSQVSALTTPFSEIVDLRTGAVVSSLVDRTQVPDILGMGSGSVIVADAAGSGFEVSAVNWTTKSRALLGVVPSMGAKGSTSPPARWRCRSSCEAGPGRRRRSAMSGRRRRLVAGLAPAALSAS